MFWTDWGDRSAGIYRSWMDGSNISCIVSEGVRWPNGITADESWLYWTEAYGDRIERADFNGGHRTVVMEGLPHPYAIAVFKVGSLLSLSGNVTTGILLNCVFNHKLIVELVFVGVE